MSTPQSSRHQQALALAAAGIPIFPCRVDSKEPATDNGFLDATTDAAQIDAWWAEADFNIGVEPERAGWCVVDLDMGFDKQGNRKDGVGSWSDLQAREGDAPITYTVRSPGGGFHLYFTGSLPSTASKVAKWIDTRGQGGYVLVPPSVVDGKPYTVTSDIEPQPLPDWFYKALGAKKVEPVAALATNVDTGDAERRATDYLKGLVAKGEVSIEGQGGDNRLYQVCCFLRDLGCDPERSLRLLVDIWNPHCVPPWSEEELGVKIENASSYAQNGEAAYGGAPPAEAFRVFLDSEPEDKPAEPRLRLYSQAEVLQMPDPIPMVEGVVMEGENFAIIGSPKQGKSLLALDVAMSVAHNLPVLNKLKVFRPGPTVYLSSEGQTYLKLRVASWLRDRGRDGVDAPFYFLPEVPAAINGKEGTDAYVKLIQSHGLRPSLIVIDTFSRSLGALDENDAVSANLYEAMARYIMGTFGCPLITLAHTAIGAPRIRGNSASSGNFDGTGLIDEDHIFTRRARGNNGAFGLTLVKFDMGGGTVGEALRWREPSEAPTHRGKTKTWNPVVMQTREALERLNAYGPDNAVSKDVLVQEMYPALPNETAEQRDGLIRSAKLSLSASRRPELAEWTADRGKTWCLPTPNSAMAE